MSTEHIPTISVNSVLAESRSSGRGSSYYNEFHLCPNRLLLEGKGGEPPEQPADGGLPEDLPTTEQTSFSYYSGVGIMFHKMCELYRNGRWDKVQWVWEGESCSRIFQDAAELFAEYRNRFPPDELLVVACEQGFKFDFHPSFGVPVFTGRWDLVHGIQPQMLEGVRTRRGLMLYAPGVYIWDYKVKWRRYENAADEWAASPQQHNYMKAWDILHPNNPCQGAVIDTVYAYTRKGQLKPEFESFFIPRSALYEQAARAHLIQAERMRVLMGNPANISECFRLGKSNKTCPHHPSVGGSCDLVGKPVYVLDSPH